MQFYLCIFYELFNLFISLILQGKSKLFRLLQGFFLLILKLPLEIQKQLSGILIMVLNYLAKILILSLKNHYLSREILFLLPLRIKLFFKLKELTFIFFLFLEKLLHHLVYFRLWFLKLLPQVSLIWFKGALTWYGLKVDHF